MAKYNISLFIFRRDLRVIDNTALIAALRESNYVIPLFIFTPDQVSDKNKYKSSNAIQFMIESLYDLNRELNNGLWVNYGQVIDVIDDIMNIVEFDAIYINDDYTPYSIKRDNQIHNFCTSKNIDLNVYTDLLLLDTFEIYTGSGTKYGVFTMFYNKTKTMKIRKIDKSIYNNYLKPIKKYSKNNLESFDDFLLSNDYYRINNNIAVKGGRKNALKLLSNQELFTSYKKLREFPEFTTSMLSAHNKFGTVSIREVYKYFNKENTGLLVKQLYWRDFYYYISTHNKNFYKYQHTTKISNPDVKIWDNNKNMLKLWTKGKTGFPLVDASMRELNETGYIHNRCRMVVAEFLVKDLLIDWKYGEQYFSKQLVDVDRAQNLGNWNWSSSYGLDASSFIRVFNVWSQSEKYDPKCNYIRRWIPELENVPAKHIHNWYKFYDEYSEINYPKPIVDHSVQRKIFLERYKKYFKKI